MNGNVFLKIYIELHKYQKLFLMILNHHDKSVSFKIKKNVCTFKINDWSDISLIASVGCVTQNMHVHKRHNMVQGLDMCSLLHMFIKFFSWSYFTNFNAIEVTYDFCCTSEIPAFILL